MNYDFFAEYYDELMSDVDYAARARYIDSIIKERKQGAGKIRRQHTLPVSEYAGA